MRFDPGASQFLSQKPTLYQVS